MSFQNPANRVTRWSVVGMEGMWTKMWDPPTTSPEATDQLLLVPQGLIRPNPVPEVMFAAGLQDEPRAQHTVQRDLMHGATIPTWDGLKQLAFFLIGDPDNDAAQGGTYPGPTLRMPRGVIFSAETHGKGPPPHTIHWHGLEPSPLNDGVGHCSMEIGHYTYQWQPNFTGTYFAHCHRNTMQHFEFGLYFALIFETPDAYFGSIASTNADGSVVLKDLNQFPIGCGRDGKRRAACNLNNTSFGLPSFPQFPGFIDRPVDSPDDRPLGPNDTNIRFPTDPHAMTVPIDVEAIMVFDDRDSVWSDLGSSAFATFPRHGDMPGINDQFNENPGANGFAAFNDYNADYWFVTGAPVPAPRGGTATIPRGIVVPPQLMSGISGVQVSIEAETGKTILVRILNAAYNVLKVTFPVDIVIIAWDGRALGVAPYGHNNSYLVEAGTPIEMSVARRFDALIMETSPLPDGSTIKAQFINNKSQTPGDIGEEVVMTALVPINIGGEILPPLAFALSGKVLDQLGAPVEHINMLISPKTLGGSAPQTVLTDVNGNYTFTGIIDGTYDITPSKPGIFIVPASKQVIVNNNSLIVPNFVSGIASFSPGSYNIQEALDSLKSIVGLKSNSSKDLLRFDVAPVPFGDSIIDVRDSLNILRMVVGLPPV